MEMIKIDFTKTSDDGIYSFSDALHLPIDHTYTDEEIEAMKQSRFDNWMSHILSTTQDTPVEDPQANTDNTVA